MQPFLRFRPGATYRVDGTLVLVGQLGPIPNMSSLPLLLAVLAGAVFFGSPLGALVGAVAMGLVVVAYWRMVWRGVAA